MANPNNAPENEFWIFSLRLYSQPGVAAKCLALQESCSLDVNVLLFCAWLGWSRRALLSPLEIQEIEAVVAEWHEGVVKPLRSVRQFLKNAGGAQELRGQVKAIELAAEKMEQDLLFAFAERNWAAREAAVPEAYAPPNMQLYVRSRQRSSSISEAELSALVAGIAKSLSSARAV